MFETLTENDHELEHKPWQDKHPLVAIDSKKDQQIHSDSEPGKQQDHDERIKQLRTFMTVRERLYNERMQKLEARLKEVEDSRIEIALRDKE